MAIQQILDNTAEQQRQEMEKLLNRSKKNTMKIKKIGHCCLVIEIKGVRILTDPGAYTTEQNEEKNIDIVAITHEHGDHFHIESLKIIIANNPGVKVVTNTAVGKLLAVEGIAFELLEDGDAITLNDIVFEGHGEHHATIYKEMGQVQNTGFMIDDTLFYPGDAFTLPGKPVSILALPVAAPWLKLSEVLEYAFAVKPTTAFPVHDIILSHPQMMQPMFIPLLEQEGIKFVPLNPGDTYDFE